MSARAYTTTFAAALSVLAFVACSSAGTGGRLGLSARIDSLNTCAYQWRYRDIDSLHACASAALSAAHEAGLGDAEAEAVNNLLYERFLLMDFDSALVMADEVRRLTSNQIELLIADVMCMKIAQRVSDNRAFFTHRMHAGQRLNRILEEADLLTPRQQHRFDYARGEFYIVSATYFYYVDQLERAQAEIDLAEPSCHLESDTAQWLYFCYMKGSGDMIQAPTERQVIQEEFDYLFKCFTFAKNYGYRFFQANALQSLAMMMNDSVQRRVVKEYKPEAVSYLTGLFDDGAVPERMAETAYELFYDYQDRFQSACALRTMGELSFLRGDPMQAITYYKQALLLVSGHHLPEWISGFHQHMSLAYAALDDIESSARHRNAYLDQLAVTRQDVEQESRYVELQAESRRLSLTLMWLIVLAVSITLLLVYLQRRMRRNARAQEWLLQQALLLTESPASAPADSELHSLNRPDGEGGTGSPGFGRGADKFDQFRAERRALAELAEPYRAFITSANRQVRDLEQEHEALQEQQAATLMRVASGKRQNVEKRAKLQLVYAIVPFLDRVVCEVERMRRNGAQNTDSLTYICQLIDQINTYNDILTQWIQMQRGQLSLRITTFPLAELFGLIRQSHYAFDQKNVRLQVGDPAAVVKADRALTLFMLNTLADNARKFTPAGGSVTISADNGEASDGAYVEVSVTDTGCGLSAAEVDTIRAGKVFDTSETSSADGKGFGFGLMNCKGIIEKYRKTSSLFAVCQFGVESKVGEGSRFSFRLPRVLTLIACLLLTAIPAGAQTQAAYRLMDSVYFANVSGQYERAMVYADSVVSQLNAFHQNLPDHAPALMQLADTLPTPADYVWWQQQEPIDFSLVLGLRNEVAVAALGLHDWPLYRSNNRIYTHLYKLVNQDTTIESYCQSLERTQANWRIAMAIIIILLLSGLITSYFLYFRPRMLFRIDISQLLHLNRRLLALATLSEDDPDTLSRQLLAEALTGINGIHYVREVSLDDGGMLRFDYGDELPTNNQRTLDQLLSRYVYLILNERVTRQGHYADHLELAEDEHRRALYEENQLHVQNQIMDNCLSTIKHESMYYPGRIRLLAEKMLAGEAQPDALQTLGETVAYYKQIYTLLSEQAESQSGAIAFRRQAVTVESLMTSAQAYFQSRVRTLGFTEAPTLHILPPSEEGLAVRGDADLLTYLIENLIDVALDTLHTEGVAATPDAVFTLQSATDEQGRFARVSFGNPVQTLSEEALHELFMPRHGGIPYLRCKQVIREHDTFLGHPGCRINAEPLADRGHVVWFTVPIISVNSHGQI